MEEAAEDEGNKKLSATDGTSATGVTEEDNNSTIDEDGIGNEDDGLILEEGEIVEDGGKNMEAAAARDECEDSRAMVEEDTKPPGAPRSIPRPMVSRTQKQQNNDEEN